MDVREATRSYEAWLAKQTSIVKEDLKKKHEKMDRSPFEFLRATFYRWLQLWPIECHALADAPELLGIGDLHLENFGTWRDTEGRLIWGINDLDEAHPVSYTSDLVRLATSAVLAARGKEIRLSSRTACEAILEGYESSIARGGQPVVLAERRRWLRRIAINQLQDPQKFWKKFATSVTARGKVPHEAFRTLLPPKVEYRVIPRRAGIGSLGRPRFAAIAEWGGAKIAREAKALVQSAAVWAGGRKSDRDHFTDLMSRAVRIPDPFYRVADKWIVRRLAPDCTKIEMLLIPRQGYETKMLRAMGWETANMHLANDVGAVSKDLRGRKSGWLIRAADHMANVVEADWQAWRTRVHGVARH